MSQHAPARRYWSLDLARGFYISLMVLAHSIFFMYAGSNVIVLTLNALGDFLAFTGLLMISGATGYIAYIHQRHHPIGAIKRIAKRLLAYLIGYYVLTITAVSLQQGWSWTRAFSILSFNQLVPFTEFIPPLIFFALLKIPLRPIHLLTSKSWGLTGVVGSVSYFVGFWLLKHPPNWLPATWQALLFGRVGYFSFPILQYMPVYLWGIWLGRQIFDDQRRHLANRAIIGTSFFSLSFGLLLISISLLTNENWNQVIQRFPPTPAFLALGIAGCAAIIHLFRTRLSMDDINGWKLWLVVNGQNAFADFFSHTSLMYAFSILGFPKIRHILVITTMWLGSWLISVYLSKILPLNYAFGLTFIDWCECQEGACPHSREQRISRQIKELRQGYKRATSMFRIKIGNHEIPLFTTKVILGVAILLISSVSTVGLIEERQIHAETIASLRGNLSRNWQLVNNTSPTIYSLEIPRDTVEGFNQFELSYIIHPENSQQVILQGSLTQASNSTNQTTIWQAEFQLNSTNPGNYIIQPFLKANLTEIKLQPSILSLTYPLHITWTVDWEGYDVPQSYLKAMASIAEYHQIPLTHFFNPRIYTTNEISPERAEYLTNWVINRRDTLDEEIGLHLHMFPDFIASSGASAKAEPAWGGGWTPGYDILTSAYSTTEFVPILNFAKQLFLDHGLGTPFMYRAGGWFANLDTLNALVETGFTIDSSGRTAYQFGTNHLAGHWQLQPTTKPYYPSTINQNSDQPPPNLKILEIPNNGGDDFAYSAQAMIERFDLNYPVKHSPLLEPAQVTYLSHPHWFKESRQQALDQVFNYIDQYRFDRDQGPVIYVPLSTVAETWFTLAQSTIN